MKKSELKSGMRVVHGKHPCGPITGIVIRDMGLIVFEGHNGGYNYLDSYTPSLSGSNSSWDITEVYDVCMDEVLNPSRKSKLIWKRVEKTQSQIQLEQVISKLSELQMNAAELQKEAQRLQEIVTKENK